MRHRRAYFGDMSNYVVTGNAFLFDPNEYRERPHALFG